MSEVGEKHFTRTEISSSPFSNQSRDSKQQINQSQVNTEFGFYKVLQNAHRLAIEMCRKIRSLTFKEC